jgi:hypothetical protein
MWASETRAPARFIASLGGGLDRACLAPALAQILCHHLLHALEFGILKLLGPQRRTVRLLCRSRRTCHGSKMPKEPARGPAGVLL